MATYSNQHWLLSHIRNSFISTDDSGICEAVMLSDDQPKHLLRRIESEKTKSASATATTTMDSYRRKAQAQTQAPQRRSLPTDTAAATPTPTSQSVGAHKMMSQMQRNAPAEPPPLREVDFVCYPGLDLSDDEDLDQSTHSFDIQMYPEMGAHRFRSNTAQKLEKLDIAKRKAARIKTVNYNEEVLPPERQDFFERKTVKTPTNTSHKQPQSSMLSSSTTKKSAPDNEKDKEPGSEVAVKSLLSEQLARSPKQVQNRFIDYARFDGTSQVGMQTKRINVYLNMLPDPECYRPLKICVLAVAKIIEVIGLVCYKATIQYPDLSLKSVQHYALYMREDNDDMEDFPPLDNREPCSKFGFSHLTLAERRPVGQVSRVDYHSNAATKSMTSEEEKLNLVEAAVRALEKIELNGGVVDSNSGADKAASDNVREYEERMLSHNEMLEAPMHRTFRLTITDKLFFKYDVTLGVSGERLEIDQYKNAKFWNQKKAVTIPIDSVAFCEVERRQLKALLRIWLKSNSSSSSSTMNTAPSGSGGASSSSPNSPSHYPPHSLPFFLLNGLHAPHQPHTRFKHYDFDTDLHTATFIQNKINCILEMRSSETRREFLHQREKQQFKKQLKS